MTDVELARRGLDAFNDGDLEAGLAGMHPDAEWVVTREHPAARTHQGHAQILACLADWRQTMEDAVGRIRGRGRDSGVACRWRSCRPTATG